MPNIIKRTCLLALEVKHLKHYNALNFLDHDHFNVSSLTNISTNQSRLFEISFISLF